mmetsp:Transcript_39040/g.93971  ORF Transcript_39040/g.93971 Transcript_39040/m.93971 type:complete len:209 (+) Transcript_39040:2931-3557(+)
MASFMTIVFAFPLLPPSGESIKLRSKGWEDFLWDILSVLASVLSSWWGSFVKTSLWFTIGLDIRRSSGVFFSLLPPLPPLRLLLSFLSAESLNLAKLSLDFIFLIILRSLSSESSRFPICCCRSFFFVTSFVFVTVSFLSLPTPPPLTSSPPPLELSCIPIPSISPLLLSADILLVKDLLICSAPFRDSLRILVLISAHGAGLLAPMC